jgi:hypothetical protein
MERCHGLERLHFPSFAPSRQLRYAATSTSQDAPGEISYSTAGILPETLEEASERCRPRSHRLMIHILVAHEGRFPE